MAIRLRNRTTIISIPGCTTTPSRRLVVTPPILSRSRFRLNTRHQVSRKRSPITGTEQCQTSILWRNPSPARSRHTHSKGPVRTHHRFSSDHLRKAPPFTVLLVWRTAVMRHC